MITYFGTNDDLQGMGFCHGDDAFLGGRAARRARREKRKAGKSQRRERLRKVALSFLPGGKAILAAQLLKKKIAARRAAAAAAQDETPQIEQTTEPMIPEPVSVVPESVSEVVDQQEDVSAQEQEGAAPDEGAPEGEPEQVEGLSGDMTIPIVIAAAIGLYLFTRKG